MTDANEKIVMLQMTKSQCVNVADFIEFGLIQHIKNDPDLDNVLWVADMIDAYRALRVAGGLNETTD